jgi:hypothetical protein
MLTARLGRVSVTGRRNPCMMPTAPEVLKAPTLLVDLRGTGGRKHLNHETLLRERWTRSCALQRHRHLSLGCHHAEQIIFEEGSVEAIASLREQDDEFCRRLQIAIEMGSEFCPTTVSTKPCTSRLS